MPPDETTREATIAMLLAFAKGKHPDEAAMAILEEEGYVRRIFALTAEGTERAEELGVRFND